MANEISLTVNMSLTNGNLKKSFAPGQLSVTQTTLGAHDIVNSVGTSEEDLTVGDVGTLGYVFLRNLDSSNYVTYGPKSGGSMIAFGRIKAGEVAVLRLEPGITWRWQANTATVKVHIMVLEA